MASRCCIAFVFVAACLDKPPPPVIEYEPCISQLHDSFETTMRCEPWGDFYEHNGATITQGDGKLVLSPGTRADANAGCVQKSKMVFPPEGVQLEVVRSTTAVEAYTTLQVEFVPAVEGVNLHVAGNQLRFANYNASAVYAGLPYDAVTMRWWKLRPEMPFVIAEYSADGLAWFEIGRENFLFSNMIQINLAAGLSGDVATAETAEFRHLNECPVR